MKKILVLAILICCSVAGWAISPPQLRCVSVDATGDVTLSWLQPADATGFNQYLIYASPDGTSFNQIGQLNSLTTTTFLHSGANAVNQPLIYYYVAACSANECAFSDTLSTLEFYLSNQGSGLAVLNWSPIHTPSLPSSATSYDIFREYPAGVWSPIGESTALIYRDTIDICSSMLSYRVELADASGCRSVSRVQRDLFSDVTAPDMPQLDSVSVDYTTSTIRLGWEPALSPDVTAYIIYHLENGLWVPADTVDGVTTWVDDVNPATATQQYRVAALDSCLNSSAMSDPQHNIRVTATYDLCRREAYLSWEAYEGMPMEVESYVVLFSENGGPLQVAGQTNGEQHTFTLPGLVPQSNYRCFVRAVNYGNIITASSTPCTFLFDAADNHDFVYIRYVSVVDNKDLEIKVSTGTTISFSKVHLYRSVGDDQHFVHLDEQYSDGTDTYIFLDDRDLRVGRNLYYYKASIENECGVETKQSHVAHNIVLTGSSESETRRNHLDWNAYDGWQGGVGGYWLRRKSEADFVFSEVGGYLSGINYDDDVTALRKEGEGMSYYVEAEEVFDEYGFMEKSVSNTIILKQLPISYIPNAFYPKEGGINSVFLPIHSFVTMENYNMYIYSREGNLVFHTRDPYEGWNGGYNGTLMPAGCYVYKISYTYGSDGEYEAVGTVTLIR